MKKLLSSVSVGLLLAVNSQAFAQEQGGDENSGSGDRLLDTVYVTSQKKSESEAAQDVPIALTAFNAEMLEVTLSADLRDVGFYSPNTQLLENATVPGTASFVIRGLGSPESTVSVEPAVGLVKDGLVYAQRFGSFIEAFDLESVEVLRGPQGTLFGRNATGGVVNVRSRRPKLAAGIGGEVRAVIGSDNRRDLMGYADLTIVPEKFGLLVSAAGLSTDGPVDNINAIGGTLGDKEVKNYRAAALFEPNSDFDLSLIVERNENTSDTALAVDPTYSTSFFNADRDHDFQIDIETTTYVAEANLNVPGGVLTGIIGYRDTFFGDNGPEDLDGGPTSAFDYRQVMNHDQSSVEVRYATTDLFDRLDFTVGAFWMDQSLDIMEARYRLVPSPRIQAGGATQDTASWALFGQSDIYLTDTVTFTLGARYTHEEKDFNLSPRTTAGCDSLPLYGTFDLPSLSDCVFVGEVSDSWNDFSPMARVNWKPTESFLGFASYSKGFRSGGYNSRAIADGLGADGLPIPYDDEVLTSYEIGFKSDWFDRALRFNGSVFFNQVDDLQRSVSGPPPEIAQTILNAGKADISGFELETILSVFQDGVITGDSLVLAANYGYVDADYTFFDTDSDGISDADQLDFGKVAPSTYSVSLMYDTPVQNLGSLAARVAYRHEDKMWPDTFNTRAELPAIGELDASVRFTNADDWWSVTAFVKNATDEESIYQVLPVVNDVVYPRPGRRYGIELSAKF